MNTDESRERKDDSPLTPGYKRAKTLHTEELWGINEGNDDYY